MARMLVALLFAALTAPVVVAEDWPQYRGPHRNGTRDGATLMTRWPDGGPKLLWTASGLGKGYSTPAIVGERIYVTGLIETHGVLFCLDTRGALKWKVSYGPEYAGGSFRGGRGARFAGARTTPTVHDGRIYLLSGMGVVYCLKAADGSRIWSVDVFKTFGGQQLKWGLSESLLIEGGQLIVTPGGAGATMVALDLATGKTRWTTKGLSHKAAYCSPVAVDHGTVRMILTMTSDAVIGVAPADGTLLWQHAYRNRLAIHPVTPVYHDGHVFATSGYGEGGVIVKLDATGTQATEVWRQKTFDTHHGGLVRVGDHVYGTSDRRPRGKWMCVALKTGAVAYTVAGIGKGSVIAAGGMLYGYAEDGTVALAKASPAGWTSAGSFKVTAGENEHWAHPAIAGGVLYIRHGSALMAYDIRAAK